MGKKTEIFVISNSGGRSSAYMTERLLREAEHKYIISFQNTGRENNETLEFLRKCETRWVDLYGHGITWLEYNPDLPAKYEVVTFDTAHRITDTGKISPFEKMIRNIKHLPNPVQRTCTSELKIKTEKRFMRLAGYEHWTKCVGFRFDEQKRYEKTKGVRTRQRWELWFPMVDWGITKVDVNNFWLQMPFDLNLKSYQGNCDLCFLKGSGKKRQIIRENPTSADWWIRMERLKGETFAMGYGYNDLVEGMRKAPEFEFGEDYECDIPCFCSID